LRSIACRCSVAEVPWLMQRMNVAAGRGVRPSHRSAMARECHDALGQKTPLNATRLLRHCTTCGIAHDDCVSSGCEFLMGMRDVGTERQLRTCFGEPKNARVPVIRCVGRGQIWIAPIIGSLPLVRNSSFTRCLPTIHLATQRSYARNTGCKRGSEMSRPVSGGHQRHTGQRCERSIPRRVPDRARRGPCRTSTFAHTYRRNSATRRAAVSTMRLNAGDPRSGCKKGQ